ncbi:MAG TPA: hypothetical protein VF395_02450 [Polyangiaceae bacterium]
MRSTNKAVWSGALAFAMMTGCYLGTQSAGTSGGGPGGGTITLGDGGSHPSPIDPTASGLPCDVATLLTHYCVGCHSSPPSGGAPQPLLSIDNLKAASTTVPGKAIGAVSVDRLQNGTMPPKPASSPSAAEISAFASWVNGGMQAGACGGFDAGQPIKSPYDTPVQCTSTTHWTGRNDGSSRMYPGRACVSCHASSGGEAPQFAFAGTVYPTAHEPDDCNGGVASGPVTVVVTGADGAVVSRQVNSAGNFSYEGPLALPYTAKVISGGGERAMSAAQTSGDCNSCHTETGTNKAPGRIMAP